MKKRNDEFVCKHNKGVNCSDQQCDKCGFDPDTASKRLEEAKKNMLKSFKLKPCPFCGGAAAYNDVKGGFAVRCKHCNITTPVYGTKVAANNAWNWRVK